MDEKRPASSRSFKDSAMAQTSILTAAPNPFRERSFNYSYVTSEQSPVRRGPSESFSPPSATKLEASMESGIWNAPRQQQNYSMQEDGSRNSYDPMAHRAGPPPPEYPIRPDVNAAGSKQRLPSLSSLFGAHRPGGTQPSLPHRSSSYSTAPPQDSRQASVSAGRQSWDSMYSTRPGSSYYSYENRAAPKTTSDLPPPPSHLPLQPLTDPRRSQDTRHDSQDSASFSHAASSSSSSSRWSPRPEPSYQEYLPQPSRDTPSSYRPQSVTRQSVSQFDKRVEAEGRPIYQDTTVAASTPSYPQAPSNAASEPMTTKDSLGPKIWTGTQFLPRFVRQAEVPGEGTCYFYDDGTHCKTHIDGEPVNAHWGVTKAGKPRKRLAIACITCREKKIKCDPDYPKCVQCEKFGRHCKFKNAPRGGQGSPEASPAEGDDASPQPQSRRSDEEAVKVGARKAASSLSPQTLPEHSSPEMDTIAPKRRKNGSNDFTAVPVRKDRNYSRVSSPGPKGWAITAKPSTATRFKWPSNPLDVDQALVVTLMDCYFANVQSTTYSLFPAELLMKWLTDRQIEKSEDDILLIYALLAVATIFSSMSDRKERGKDFASASSIAFSKDYSLQVVQSRFLFAVYYDSIGRSDQSWDALGSAIRAAMGINLHLELSVTDTSLAGLMPFGFSSVTYRECRRRTFWSCYIMDSLGACRDGRLSTIRSADIFLRMPCDNKNYGEERDVQNPVFDTAVTLSRNSRGTYGVMAYLVHICATWGDIMSEIYRSTQRSSKPDPTCYERMSRRLDMWLTSIPPCLAYSQENFDKQIVFSLFGSFLTMHAVYHAATVKLNTAVDASNLPGVDADLPPRIARKHAESLLRLGHDQAIARSQNPRDPNGVPPLFAGYAIALAVEVVAQAKLFDRTLELVGSAVQVLTELAETWPVVAKQQADVLARIQAQHT